MTDIEKRRGTLINFAYYAVLAALYYVFIKYAFDVVWPFAIAFAVSMLLQKPIRFIAQKSRIPKKIISVITVLFILCAVLGIVVFVGYKLMLEFKDFGQFVVSKLNDLPQTIASIRDWTLGAIGFLPDKIETAIGGTVSSFSADLIASTTENGISGLGGELAIPEGLDVSSLITPLGGLLSTAKRIPLILSGVLVGIIACFFATADYDNIVSILKRNVSEKQEKLIVETKRLFSDVIGKMVKSYATIIFITFCEVTIGLNILSLFNIYNGGYIIVIAILTALLDILPVFGTGTVFVPWAVYSLIKGNYPLAIGLIVMLVLITVIRQVVEPHLVAMNVGIHPIFTIASMYIGIQLFGVAGIFILPITVVLLKMLNSEGIIHLWGRKKESAETEDSDKSDKKEESDDQNDEGKTDENA